MTWQCRIIPLVAVQTLVSEREYIERYADSPLRLEFVNGELLPKREDGMTKRAHFDIADDLTYAFRVYRTEHGGHSGATPTTNVSFGTDRIYRLPDIAYWAPGTPVGDDIFLPPTVAVEIVSPDQSVPALREKCRAYIERGVEVCWLIDPAGRWVEVFDRERDAVRLRPGAFLECPQMPGFRYPIAELWRTADRPRP